MRSFNRSRHMCEWDDFRDREAFVRGRLADSDREPIPPFLLLSEPGVTAREQRACSEIWTRKRLAAAAVERGRLAFRFTADDDEKIKLGYLSNDFHDHATALLLVEMLEAHDRSRFEIHAYSYGKDDGKDMRRRLTRAFDRFHDIASRSDADAAREINADGIHILIDLKGFTQNTRTSILALRPAPLQVNYLGYPGTLGAGLCDYIISDVFVTPEFRRRRLRGSVRPASPLLSAPRAQGPHRPHARPRLGRLAEGRFRLLLLQPGVQAHARHIRRLVSTSRRRVGKRAVASGFQLRRRAICAMRRSSAESADRA